jgi:hypothetical protein
LDRNYFAAASIGPPLFFCDYAFGAVTLVRSATSALSRRCVRGEAWRHSSLHISDELLGQLGLVDQPVQYLGLDLFDDVERNIEAVIGAQICVILELRHDLLNDGALEAKAVLVE